MKPLPFSTLLLIVGATAFGATDGRRPAWPVSAIVQNDPRPAGEPGVDLGKALSQVRMAYNDDDPALRAALAARQGPRPPVLVYMGGYTTNGDDVVWLERDYRRGIAMTDVAKLGADLTADTTEFTLVEPRDGELAVVASTADQVDPRDRTRYCFWLRVGDEFMKVTAVDAATGRVKVKRGFDRTSAVAHRAGAVVLAPVYLGNRARDSARFSTSWPGARNRIRYAADTSTPEGRAFKARCVAAVMRAGYDGAWWDTYDPMPYNLCDPLGRALRGKTWDFERDAPRDFASWIESMNRFAPAVRELVRRELGREPVIYANVGTLTYQRGGRMLIGTGGNHDLLDGYCLEDSYVEPLDVKAPKVPAGKADSVIVAPPPATFRPVELKRWVYTVESAIDAANTGRNVIAMIGPAGYLAARINPSQPNYESLVRYAYASYLLTVTAERATSFGLPLLVQTKAKGAPTAQAWPDFIYAPIGEPTEANQLAALQLPGSPCYARTFTNAYVVVYPGREGAAVEVSLPAGLVEAGSGQPVATKIHLSPGEGRIFLSPRAD